MTPENPTDDPEDDLVPAATAGKILGGRKPLSDEALKDWRRRRTGPPYFTIGRSVRYRVRDLRAWLAAQRVDPTAPSVNSAA